MSSSVSVLLSPFRKAGVPSSQIKKKDVKEVLTQHVKEVLKTLDKTWAEVYLREHCVQPKIGDLEKKILYDIKTGNYFN